MPVASVHQMVMRFSGLLGAKSQPESKGDAKLLLAFVGWNLQCMALNERVSWLLSLQ